MWRKITWVLALFISAPLFAKETDLRLYRPFTETNQQVPLTLSANLVGQCSAQSALIKRDDAWRCQVDHKIYDPCFVAPFGSHLKALCIASPWSTEGIEITVSMPLDNSLHETLDMSRTYPWGIQLTNGEMCHAILPYAEYDGLPARYLCDGHSTLIGHLQRCQNTWKILQHTLSGVETVAIDRAWF